MTDTLKPCPFCGSTQIYVTHTRYYDNEDTVCVFCNACKQHVILEDNEAEGLNDKTRELAIEAWNTRAERTCQNRDADIYPGGMVFVYSVCESMSTDGQPSYCPNCGAKVVEE